MTRRFVESEHPRWPAGSPGDVDGQFRLKAGAKRDLAILSRSTLLKYARERGLVLPRGHPDDDIRAMIRRFDSGVEPEWIERAGKQIAAKKTAKKAAPKEVLSEVSPEDKKRAAELRRHAGVTRQLGHMRIANNPKGSYHHTRGQQDLKDADRMENEADQLDPPAHLRAVAKKAPAKVPAKVAAPKKTAVQRAEEKVEAIRGQIGLARDKRRGRGERQRGQAEARLEVRLRDAKAALDKAKRDAEVEDYQRRQVGLGGPSSRPPPAIPTAPVSTLAPDDQARVRTLIRRDPQIFATVRDRFGRVSTSGNLSTEDAAFLETMHRRDRAYVEHVAQTATIERDIRRRAKTAGQTPAEYRAVVAARLKELLDDKPIAVRVRDEVALRDILDGGRFKTSHEGARRAAGLGTDIEHRRLGEQVQGVPAGTPHERRPVYGYVAVGGIEPALHAGVQTPGIREREGQEDVLSAYGQIQVVLKPHVRGRTTATVGDSLDDIGFIRPTPIDSPGAESVGSYLDWLSRPGFSRTGYVEAQVYGGVRVEDIAEVVFPDQPAAYTVAALERAGISWRVLRQDWAAIVSGRAGGGR